ncbi:MAG: hypothetical protein MK081_08355 [Flavobacteriales bacterium]|nr:hypothetical protein [Flavobacteriales bacterium]
MKKFLILLFALLAFQSESQAQGGPYDYINVGVGVSGWGIPVFVGAAVTVAEQITVGAMFSGQRRAERFRSNQGTVRWVHTIIGLSANANYHFLEPGEEFDVYAGLSVGYYFWNTRLKESFDGFDGIYTGGGDGGVGLSLQAGGRYMLDNGIVLYGEIGGGTVLSSARIGVSFPLNF